MRFCRLFFWFRGADHRRIGGPWWYRDFYCEADRDRFLDDIYSFLYKYALDANRLPPYRTDQASKGVIYIHPPEGAEIIEVKL